MQRFDQGWRQINSRKLPLMTRLRLRFGLRWRRNYPTTDDFDKLANWLLAIVSIICLLGLYATMDAHDAKLAAELEHTKTTQRFADFLNGGVLFDDAKTVAIKCASIVEAVK